MYHLLQHYLKDLRVRRDLTEETLDLLENQSITESAIEEIYGYHRFILSKLYLENASIKEVERLIELRQVSMTEELENIDKSFIDNCKSFETIFKEESLKCLTDKEISTIDLDSLNLVEMLHTREETLEEIRQSLTRLKELGFSTWQIRTFLKKLKDVDARNRAISQMSLTINNSHVFNLLSKLSSDSSIDIENASSVDLVFLRKSLNDEKNFTDVEKAILIMHLKSQVESSIVRLLKIKSTDVLEVYRDAFSRFASFASEAFDRE